MQLTQKETMLLQDLQSHEQLCVEKYDRFAERACDEQLKNLFSSIGKTEQTHLDTLQQMMRGTVPMLTGGGQQPSSARASSCSEAEKQEDAYLCKDALSTEKHVSAMYDTCIFEFTQKQMRDTLNHIQKEEQEHGKRIYDYMAANGMYA